MEQRGFQVGTLPPPQMMFGAGLRLAEALKTSSPWRLPTPEKRTRRASLEPFLRAS